MHLGTLLQQQGIACRCCLEEDDPHPIACFDLKLKDLAQTLPPLWRTFTEQALQDPAVTIIEGRLWQNTALFMYMAEYSVEDIVNLHQLVWQVLTPLSPVLLYLNQDNVDAALRRLYTSRGEKWMESALQTTSQYQWFQSRGLKDLDGWIRFFKEWQVVADDLYSDWPFWKTKIKKPHDDWELAYQEMYRFMQFGW